MFSTIWISTIMVLNNSSIIKNISHDHKEILHNIMLLYNNESPFDCDMTASTLNFYKPKSTDKYTIPIPKLLFDIFPQTEDTIQIEPFKKLPLDNSSIHSIVVDLPFLICPKNCASMNRNYSDDSNLLAKRFSSFYPREELIETIYWWLGECYRVLDTDGIAVWKMQSTVSGGRQVWSVPFTIIAADSLGFYLQDEFILASRSRLINPKKYKKQVHARKFTSSFLVFRKNKKLHSQNSILKLLSNCKNQNLENKIYPFK